MAITDKLTAIADAIRQKKDSTAIFTLDQMATEIEGIVTSDDLPNAEEAYFGSGEGTTEDGYVNSVTNNKESLSWSSHWGYKFIANTTFGVSGIRFYCPTNVTSRYLQLWDIDTGTLLAEAHPTECTSGSWVYAYFSSTINCFAGKTYSVAMWGSSAQNLYGTPTVNEKITIINRGKFLGETETRSDCANFQNNDSWYAVDIVITEAITESVVTEYKVQRTTMDDIAEEVQRISGSTEKMNPAQIEEELSAVILQEKTVTPTAEQQEVIPDSGYYGLSKVTVEAAETSGGVLATNEKKYQFGTAKSVGSLADMSFTSNASGSSFT